jgi:hypothetical protein
MISAPNIAMRSPVKSLAYLPLRLRFLPFAMR